MLERLKARWDTLRLAPIKSRPLALIPWSAIRRVGQSRLLAFTIIVPFIGSLILFNKHVVDVLTLSPELVGRFFHRAGEESEVTAQHLTLTKLYFIYFGLSFLGFASAIFALVCPLEIKSFDSPRSYLEAEGPLASKSRMGLIIPNIATNFLLWSDVPDPHRAYITRQLGNPVEFSSLFVHVIISIWDKLLTDQYLGPIPESGPTEDDHFLDHRGRPKIIETAEALMYAPTVFQNVVYMVQEIAAKDDLRNDVLTLQYLALDHSKPWSRVAVAMLYSVGFMLLLIPAAMTFTRVLVSIL